MQRLPPLNALQTFEAVARLCSITRASEELHVTQSAVSQQIKLLEDHLGLALFIRRPGGLELTESAIQLLPEVSQAFRIIQNAVAEIDLEHKSILINTSTSFAMQWLMTRLSEFEQSHQGSSVYINAAEKGAGQSAVNRYDVDIRYTMDPLNIAPENILLKEWLLPVCSPEYKKKNGLNAETFFKSRFLLNSPEASDWRPWLKGQGFSNHEITSTLIKSMALPTDASAIEMAVEGHGIALANLHYSAEKIEKGVLVPAMPVDAFALGFHFIDFDPAFLRPLASHFLDWLRIKARQSEERISPWTEKGRNDNIGLPLPDNDET